MTDVFGGRPSEIEVVHIVEFAQLNRWRSYGTPADTIEAMRV